MKGPSEINEGKGAKPKGKCPYNSQKRKDTETEEKTDEDGSEARGKQPQARDTWSHQVLQEARGTPPHPPSKPPGAAVPMASQLGVGTHSRCPRLPRLGSYVSAAPGPSKNNHKKRAQPGGCGSGVRPGLATTSHKLLKLSEPLLYSLTWE